MEKEEYLRKAKELHHTDDMIAETIKEAKRFEEIFGRPYDYSMDLVELPISDPNPLAKYGANQ